MPSWRWPYRSSRSTSRTSSRASLSGTNRSWRRWRAASSPASARSPTSSVSGRSRRREHAREEEGLALHHGKAALREQGGEIVALVTLEVRLVVQACESVEVERKIFALRRL